jgi:acyl-CoA dehydrogenase
MNDQQRMIAEMAGELFADLAAKPRGDGDWDAIEQVALPALLLSEEQGGFGGSWEDALIVFRLAGYNALALPLVEATIAAALAGSAGPQGRGTIAPAADGDIRNGRFTGCIKGAAWGDASSFVVAPSPDGGSMLAPTTDAEAETSLSISGEPRTTWRVSNASIVPLDVDVFALGALARSAQIAGALDAALAMAVGYVNERQQFGRPLAKFQAVQQNLASFACEAAAANCAALGAAQARTRGQARYEIAAAKLRANRAVGVGTAIAHQVHGAIGFTEEYPLHPLTRRLWTWRSEFGSDGHWSAILGDIICERGADNFWPDMTALST